MKKLAIAVIMLIAAAGCSHREQEPVLSGTIEAEETDVTAEISGKIIEIVPEGHIVNPGDVIARIDSESSLLRLDIAKSQLETARLKLSELESGARSEQLEIAQAAVDEARARVNEIKSGSRPEVIKQAEAAAAAQKAILEELTAGADAEKIAQARAAYEQAQIAVTVANNNYDLAQTSYGNLEALYLKGAATKTQLDEAKVAMDNARLSVAKAEKVEEISESALTLLEKGASQQAIQAQQANYEQALSSLELAKNGSTENAVQAAQSQLEQAIANYEMLKNGNTSFVLEAAREEVARQEANLKLEQLNYGKHEISSPVEGIVLYNNVQLSEMVTAAQILSTVQTTGKLYIKVYVPQRYLGLAAVGGHALIKTSALPDTDIQGKIVFKSPKGEYTPKNIETNEAKEENTVFEVKIEIIDNLDKLSPGMTADVILTQ